MKNPKSYKSFTIYSIFLIFSLLAAACAPSKVVRELNPPQQEAAAAAPAVQNQHDQKSSTMIQPVQNAPAQSQSEAAFAFTLETDFGSQGMIFIGVGGDIDGVVNPTLYVAEGGVVEITLLNGDGMQHDISFLGLDNAASDYVNNKGDETSLVFTASESGEYTYICTVPGHRQAGMEGLLVVGEVAEREVFSAPSIALDPSNLPAPIGVRDPHHHVIEIETIELEGHLADGSTFTYWTFDGTVPGPFLRMRVGDTADITLTNRPDSTVTHSIDFHAVTGPGGGAAVTQAPPGESRSFTFKALNPGLYVYHCATPMVAHHIANGMYGLILVEPEEGLPEVDREFYVMQGEIYTLASLGEKGRHEISIDKLLNETPEYFVFNGSVDALTGEYPLHANVGETVRIYFGVGGPNFVSSFHVIGEIFDRVYDQASITSPPLTDVQTILVPPGGAAVVDFKVDYPGRYILVDHALSRLERGLVGFLLVEGEADPEIFHSDHEVGGGH
jgi:nitrite reductase (NO-forming)